MPDRTSAQDLAAALRELRVDAGVSGTDLAARIDTSQATVSRYESGRLVPTMLAAGRIGWALRAPAPTRRRLVELARAVAEERAGLAPKRVLLQQGVAHLQRRIRQRERLARHVATFHPTLVPGLLQTEGYMRAILAGPPPSSPDEDEAWLRERQARQLHMSQPGRGGVQIVAESALHWGAAGPAVMAEQCAHLADLVRGRPSWRVGVLPRLLAPGTPPVFATNGFTIHDGTTVHIGTTAGNALITDADIVADHVEQLALVEAAAVFGEDAATHFRRLAAMWTADVRQDEPR